MTVRSLKNNSIFIFILLFFILINPKLSSLVNLFHVSYPKSKIQFDGEIVYYILYASFGAIIGNMQTIRNRFVIDFFAPLFYIASSLLIGYVTFMLSMSKGKYIHTFYMYTSILVAIGAFSFFVYLKERAERFILFDRPLKIVANNSLAIYGLHALILDFIFINGYRDFGNPVTDISFVFSVTVSLSLLFAVAIKKFDKYKLFT